MTIIEQLEAVQGEMTTLKANVETTGAAIVAKDAEIVGLNAQIVALQSEKASIETAHATAISDIQGKLDAEIAAHAESKKQIEEFGKKLSDPAYKMASATGDEKAVPDGGSAPAMAESKTLGQQMKEISDPKDRRAFYLANEKEIKAGN